MNYINIIFSPHFNNLLLFYLWNVPAGMLCVSYPVFCVLLQRLEEIMRRTRRTETADKVLAWSF